MVRKITAGAFTKIDDAFVVVYSAGVFKQVDAFESNGFLYAKAKGGFVRLMDHGRTSVPSVTWQTIDGVSFKVSTVGYLTAPLPSTLEPA